MKRQELLLWPKGTGGILRALGLQFNTWPVLGTGVKDPALLQLQLGSRLRVRSDHAVGRPKTKKKKKSFRCARSRNIYAMLVVRFLINQCVKLELMLIKNT